MVLRSNFALLLTIQFALLFIFFFRHDFATILSGPYLWNRYSQRLQTECAAWSCCLILHYCLPSNSLRYLFIFFLATILSGPYLWNRYSQRLQIECVAWSCGLILHCCLPSNLLRYLFFFSATILSGVEFFIFGDRSSVAYRATENLSRSSTGCKVMLSLKKKIYNLREEAALTARQKITRQVLGRPVCDRGAIPRTLVQ